MSATTLSDAGLSEALSERYQHVRDATEDLAAPLSPEDQMVQSMPDVSPTKWHRAHVTWFFETFLLEDHLRDYTPFHPLYRFLFNSYYEAVGARQPRAERGLLSRPGVGEIAAYRAQVDRAMHELIAGGLGPDLVALLDLGLHHEQQHQELLLMDIKHVLSRNPLLPAYVQATPPACRATPAGAWIEHEGGVVEIGADGGGFSFDNERPRHSVFLQPFALLDRPVLCGEWLEFIDDGGYERAELWLSDGWNDIQSAQRRAPMYWLADGDSYDLFTLSGRRPVDPAEPVSHLSYYEADAFARWSGARLPTEEEWEALVVAEGLSGRSRERVTVHPSAADASDPVGHVGEVWEWTSSAYLAYPGFRTPPGAVGEYNGKFMVSQHVLRGGCCATPSGHARDTYRNFFPPSARWAFSGARLAKDLS